MLKSSWAYSLKKDDLVAYLSEFQMDTAGSVEELRRRWGKFLNDDHDSVRLTRLRDIQAKHESFVPPPSPVLMIPTAQNVIVKSPVKDEPRAEDNGKVAPTKTEVRIVIIEQIRKWNIKYNGISDPLEFIERVEELSQMYCINLNQLPSIMPELLCDRALTWFRNNNKSWNTWSEFKIDFCKFFLPTRYYEKLLDEIQKRTQFPNERFKNYVLALQKLLRHSNLTEAQKLERVFTNSHPDYQWYIRRKDFTTLDECIALAEDLEAIKSSTPHTYNTFPPNTSTYNNQQGNNGNRNQRFSNNARDSGNAFGGRRN